MRSAQDTLSEKQYADVHLYKESAEYSTREKLAIEFAELFCLSPDLLTANFFQRMQDHYDDEEIVELAGTIAFCLGFGRVSKVLNIANECPVRH